MTDGRVWTAYKSAGYLSGHQHCREQGGHHFPSKASAHPSVHQLPDQEQPSRPPAGRGCLAVEGGHRVGHQRDIPRVLQLALSGSGKDRRFPCSNAPGRTEVFAFVVNKQVYHFTCLPFGLATSPREFTKLLRPVVALLRQRGVKLHVYLDDWLIHADTPQQAQLQAQTTISVLQFLGWIINYEKSDLTPSQDFQFLGMQFIFRQFTVEPLPKMRLKVQYVLQHWMTNPNITAHNLHRLLGMVVFMASLVPQRRLGLHPVQWGGRHSRVPEDQELDRSDHSSSVGSVRGGLVGISSSPTRSSPHHQGNGSDSLHGCVQFGLGRPVRLTLYTGIVVSISKIVAHQRSGDAGRHQHCERISFLI